MSPTSPSRRRRTTWVAQSRRSPPTPRWRGGTDSRCQAGSSPESTSSPTWTGVSRTAGGTSPKSRTRASQPIQPAIADSEREARFPARRHGHLEPEQVAHELTEVLVLVLEQTELQVGPGLVVGARRD